MTPDDLRALLDDPDVADVVRDEGGAVRARRASGAWSDPLGELADPPARALLAELAPHSDAENPVLRALGSWRLCAIKPPKAVGLLLAFRRIVRPRRAS